MRLRDYYSFEVKGRENIINTNVNYNLWLWSKKKKTHFSYLMLGEGIARDVQPWVFTLYRLMGA